MIINQPKIKENASSCMIEVSFEIKGKVDTLWYKIPIEFKQYIVLESLDAFVVGLLALGMINNEDIYVKGQMSSKLNYAINHYLIKAIRLSDDKYSIIRVKADKLTNHSFSNTRIAATGISCGIDSLATIADHEFEKNDFDLKYLTYLKSGAHGVFGGELSNRLFDKGYQHALNFSKELSLPIIVIESNIMDILKINFQSLHTIIHLSCVLNLQKLINTYYYASSFRYDFYELGGFNSSWDILILKLLETESTSFYSSASQYTRFERTELVSNYEPSYNYLNVCINQLEADKKINCSQCEKCIRTLISLEILNKIHNYEKVFDLKVYYANKDIFISELLCNKELNQTNKELYLKLKKEREIKIKHYIKSYLFRLKKKYIKYKKKIKSFLNS